ncbi:succinylglutamate desuccinylase/aspartoacylase family protein [Galbibacter sp. PAP.153]|uniref:succinylglutamate desuccinylase/aspartoacylase domain-containing protein n=1 Tax=Galbibacter sp. PAP.153 TaxID=3104623 RepID=UPI003009FB58
MDVERIIGTYTSNNPGPLLFVTAGIHGNEPSGVLALQHVFEELNHTKPTINGTLVGVSGNKTALEKNVRYIDEDLNRTWTEENIKSGKNTSHEHTEMHDIIKILQTYLEKEHSKNYFLDCHTTSSASLPYISVQEVNNNDAWAHRFPTYIVRGFSDIITGDIDHYLSRIGITGFVFEAGQHTSKKAIENHEGMIWLALKEACNIKLENLSCYPECVTRFSVDNAPEQKTFKILYRHALNKKDQFKMEPGFENFSKVKKGQFLAMQNGKKITSKWNAHIFMPLYQAQGDDGFFIIDEIEPTTV